MKRIDKLRSNSSLRTTVPSLESAMVCGIEGTTLDVNHKPKPCEIVLCYEGLYIYTYPIFGKKSKLSKFIPTVDITHIRYNDQASRVILCKDEGTVLFSPDIGDLDVSIMVVFDFFFWGLNLIPYPSLINFPFYSATASPFTSRPANLSVVRYLSFAQKQGVTPCQTALKALEKYDRCPGTLFVLDSNFASSNSAYPLIETLILEPYLSILVLDNFASGSVSDFMEYLLKKSTNIHTVYFKNYAKVFFPCGGYESPSITSLKFKSCFSSPGSLALLIRELSLYSGDIQYLSIYDTDVDAASAAALAFTLKQMTTIEKLTLSNVTIFDHIYSLKLVYSSTNHLHSLNLSNWSPIPPVTALPILPHIHLNFFDFTLFPRFPFADNLHTLDVSNSKFTATSLSTLLESLTQLNQTLTLRLCDIELVKSEWEDFYALVEKLKPIQKVAEIDWSGNPLPAPFLPSFLSLFVSEYLRYLGIGRVFASSGRYLLLQLLENLRHTGIYGINLSGSPSVNLGDSTSQTIKALSQIPSLKSLNFSGQPVDEEIAQQMLRSLSLKEVIVDRTSLPSKGHVQHFVVNFLPGAKAIEAPQEDIARVKADDSKFKDKIMQTLMVPTGEIREEFFARSINTDALLDFARKFPAGAREDIETNSFYRLENESSSLRSLNDYEMRQINMRVRDFYEMFGDTFNQGKLTSEPIISHRRTPSGMSGLSGISESMDDSSSSFDSRVLRSIENRSRDSFTSSRRLSSQSETGVGIVEFDIASMSRLVPMIEKAWESNKGLLKDLMRLRETGAELSSMPDDFESNLVKVQQPKAYPVIVKSKFECDPYIQEKLRAAVFNTDIQQDQVTAVNPSLLVPRPSPLALLGREDDE